MCVCMLEAKHLAATSAKTQPKPLYNQNTGQEPTPHRHRYLKQNVNSTKYEQCRIANIKFTRVPKELRVISLDIFKKTLEAQHCNRAQEYVNITHLYDICSWLCPQNSMIKQESAYLFQTLNMS